MRLAAIYNAWDGVELLQYSIQSIIDHVDEVIIVYQDVSNWGEHFDPSFALMQVSLKFNTKPITVVKYDPVIGNGIFNEKKKRNLGIQIAREKGCTHFLHMDCDELYEDFGKAKQQFIDSGSAGSVCKLYTYFKQPTWRFENPDGYFVPFIHRLTETTQAGVKKYPFHVDPTRKINEDNVVMLDVFMHHFSWVRADIERKARNSSAKSNIERGTMLNDFYHPEIGPGFFVKDYNQKLIEVPNQFGITI